MNPLEPNVDSLQQNVLPVVILCGGRSRRMGTDKTRLPLGSGTMLSHIEDAFSTFATHQVIVVGRDMPAPESRRHPIVVRDEHLDLGPMEGLRAGLTECRRLGASVVMVTTGDAPVVSIPLYRFMVECLSREPSFQGIVPHVDDTWHPLTAVYRIEVLDWVTQRIEQRAFRVKDIADAMPVLKLTRDKMEAYDPDMQSIRNINTHEQYLQLRSELESSSKPGLTG